MTFLQLSVTLVIVHISVSQPKTALNMKHTFRSSHPSIDLTAKSFIQLVSKSNLIVDKSLLVKQLLEDRRKCFIITRPKHWGKTINLDMIKTFFEIPIDETGKPLESVTSSSSYRLFVDGEIIDSEGSVLGKLKNPFLISKHQSFVDEYLGKFPIVYVSFSEMKAVRASSMISSLANKIGVVFEQHKYILDVLDYKRSRGSNMMKRVEAQRNYTIFKKFLEKDDLTHDDVKDSINFLTELLYAHHNKSTIVLIDDYDAPLVGIISSHPKISDDEETFMHFYNGFLNSTFSSEHLQKAILTGTYRIYKEAYVKLVNTITEDHFHSSELSEFFGFSEHEVNAILQQLDLVDLQTEVASYYGGYRYKGASEQFYNPECIANFLKQADFESYLLKGVEGKRVDNLIRNFNYFKEFKERYRWAINSTNQEIKLKAQAAHFNWNEFCVLHKSTMVVFDIKSFKNLVISFNKAEISDKAIMFLSSRGCLSFDLNATTHQYLVGSLRLTNQETGEFMKRCHIKEED